MKLTVLTAVCGANLITTQWLDETIGNCISRPEIVVVANGNSNEENQALMWAMQSKVADKISGGEFLTYDDPLGSTAAFNAGIEVSTGDVIAMLHNDLMVREAGWDQKVLDFFERDERIGVVGFHGSTGLGYQGLYQVPYQLGHLARTDGWSNMEDAETHGARATEPMEVVTLDGMALIARNRDLQEWGGFDEVYPHHMYDHDLCLTARQHGKKNYLLPISVKHISGQTANGSRYQEAFGPDPEIHAAAHAAFYEKWRGTGQLPARLK